jgi:pimeloyl-ACP methyl ester carboxylesterase
MFQSTIKSWGLGLIGLVLSLAIMGCETMSGDSDDSKGGHPPQVSNILFAHGFMSSSETWNYFSQVTANENARSWTIFKTNVPKTGTIIERASALADYINAQNLPDNSLLVVGHSMGGLDLRYIISEGNQNQFEANKYYQATKAIHRFYTIATPHKGSDIAGLVKRDGGAIHDLSSAQMTTFNIAHPYAHSAVGTRHIPMLAFRFSCQDRELSDGVVDLDKQILDTAPYTQEVIDGKHTSGLERVCTNNVSEELLQDRIIDGILNNTTPRDTI